MIFWVILGCYNQTISQKEVLISGTTWLPEEDIEAVGSVQLRAFREWGGEGELKTPMIEIDATKRSQLGPYEWTIRVNRHEHEGLAIYGWLDRNNDGILCDLYSDVEPAGLLVLNWNNTDHDAVADILFDQNCAAAESLYGDPAFVASEDEEATENDE